MIFMPKRWILGDDVSEVGKKKRYLRKAKHWFFEAMMKSPENVAGITRLIQTEGWLEHFRLTGEFEAVIMERMKRARNEQDGIHIR